MELAIFWAYGQIACHDVACTNARGLIAGSCSHAQADLAIRFQAFFVLVAVGFGLGSAMSALLGNPKGHRDIADARHLAAQGISFAVVATLALIVIAVLAGPSLIALVSEPGDYRDAALFHFNCLVFALPGFILAYTGNGILQARGDTKSMQRALIFAFFANVALNPDLMFGVPGVMPGLAFNGIAVATVISQTGVAVYLLHKIFGRAMMQDLRWSNFTPELSKYAEIIGQASPRALRS